MSEVATAAADIRIKVLLAFGLFVGMWIIAGVCSSIIDTVFNSFHERRRRRNAYVKAYPNKLATRDRGREFTVVNGGKGK